MDITTIIGIVLAVGSLLLGFTIDGGSVIQLIIGSAALVVFGGTFGAVIVSFPLNRLKNVPGAVKMAFLNYKGKTSEIIDEIVDMASTARREGVLALEQRAQDHENEFLKNGLMMVVDGTDPELTRQILELEMDSLEKEHEANTKIFESAGGFAPTMGIIGTVMGLIHVLSNLSSPDTLGPAIATAFTATLYGVSSANVIYLPIASKIRGRSNEIMIEMELMLEGILALQAGENPTLIKKKLTSFQHGKIKDNPEVLEEGAELAEEI